ncbi:MAG: DUF3891 family protein [Acidobacteriaceae bacterium]|nr:DUF3891 family protein [Acidobacteriaceae bacterium]
MLRHETSTGYWLVTHVDHAHLAGEFAAKWGNERFRSPEPRAKVLKGISRHDDGWRDRDAEPQITRQGKPSAFSVELVGKYSAFEEIDFADYLAVRERAVRLIAEEDPYAAVLVSMHTHNLLSERADRSTIAPEQLGLLDDFLGRQTALQECLLEQIAHDPGLAPEHKSKAIIREHFCLLQATDNLSLLACVDYRCDATLLHPLAQNDRRHQMVEVQSVGERSFRLNPYPFAESPLMFSFPARHVDGKTFSSAAELQERYAAATAMQLGVTISA